MDQGLYPEAQEAFEEALERFAPLNEPGMVGAICQKLGMVYQCSGKQEAAEDAYRESLRINEQLGDVLGQASTLSQMGALYKAIPGRLEEAAGLVQQAVDKSVETGDISSEGVYRSNLADIRRLLKQFEGCG
jgi:tetratricopeptide (TPR) repeat protein